MFDLPGVLGTLANLAVIVLGFGTIIFLHELGHFLAAKWAGIRVLAFSMGMGPVLASYRRGLGWRRGSSEADYLALEYGRNGAVAGAVSPTEYRLSVLPLGGYVKMLGQEDANPGAVSDAPDSYQNRPVWKRMVVICAGVAMNLLTAGVLFVIVFMVGLKVQPPVVGAVVEGGPAAAAVSAERDDIGPGLLPEDRIVSVNGHTVRAFNEVSVEVAMGARDEPVRLEIERPGVPGTIRFEARPVVDQASGFLHLGVLPAVSPTLALAPSEEDWARATTRLGLPGVPMGATLVGVDGRPVDRPGAILDAVERSGGSPVSLTFRENDGAELIVDVSPIRPLMVDTFRRGGGLQAHLLGLTPLISVDPDAGPEEVGQGLEPGDVFVRVGEVEYPSYDDALEIIRAHAGGALTLVVERGNGSGGVELVTLGVEVSGAGRVGFAASNTAGTDARVGAPTRVLEDGGEEGDGADGDADGVAAPTGPVVTPAFALIDRPGTRIVSVGGVPVGSLRGVASALVAATAPAFERGDASFTVPVTLEPPLPEQPDGTKPSETRGWSLSRADIERVRSLGWSLDTGDAYMMLFEPEQVIDKADGPIAAIGRGVAKSRQVMNQAYLTFLRLFQGTVSIEHLKGPVGIAHIGTLVADRGFVWVLFFLGLVSVNLAVINFLPLPIVDGGQFLMLAYEGLRGRPIPIVVQNVVTLAGLVLIVSLFLVVTFNDIKALFGV